MKIFEPMKLNRRERKELAISKILLLLLAAIGLGVVVWLAWIRPSQNATPVNSYGECAAAGNPVQDSYPEVCVTPEGRRFINPEHDLKQSLPQESPKDTGDNEPAQSTEKRYLTITEWNVRAPLTPDMDDMLYTYTKNATAEVANFTFKRLADIGICKTDVGVAMTRNIKQNQPPYDLTNPEPVAQVGQYYYYLAYGGSPCFDSQNPEHMKVVNTIKKGDLIGAVKDALIKLQPSL